MIEEQARVCGLGRGFVWVQTRSRSTCSHCAGLSSCGAAVVGRWLGRRNVRLRALTRLSLEVGDDVVVGIDEHTLLQGALAVYVVPLAGLLAGAIAGAVLGGEAASIGGGLLGLLAGLVWARVFTDRVHNEARWQPVVLHRLAPAVTQPVPNRL